MKESDKLNMMVFMCALQKYAMKYGEIIIQHEEFDSFLDDRVNAICLAPVKGGIKVFSKKSKRRKQSSRITTRKG